MQKQITAIDISHNPELLKLAEEVQASQEPRVLTRGQERLAIIAPAMAGTAARTAPKRAGRNADSDDWLLRMADIGADRPPAEHATDVSSNKYKYLADAYADRHDREE